MYRKYAVRSRRLRSLIADLAQGGQPSIERAAAQLGLSIRTLQRQLEREGLTYSKLVESTRYEMARRLLGDPTLSVAEVSTKLGYRSPSNFSRAFARWDGASPKEYRTAAAASVEAGTE